MKKVFAIALLVFFCNCAYAQGQLQPGAVDLMGTFENTLYSNSLLNTLDKILSRQEITDISSSKTASFELAGGTNRFLSVNWLPGGAVTNQNKTVRSNKYQFNYDYVSQQVFAKSNDSVIIVNPNHLKLFYITEDTDTHWFYKFPAISAIGFEELLSADTAAAKVKLVKQRSVSVIKYTQANGSTALTGDRSDIYQSLVNYFLVFPDNTVVKVKPNAKSVLAALQPAYQTKASDLLKKYKKLDEQNLALLVNNLNND